MLLTLHRSLLLLFLVAALGGLYSQAPASTPWSIISLMMFAVYLPVFIFIIPAWRAHPRQLLWFSFLLIFYFSGYSIQTMSEGSLFYWTLARLLLIIGIFTTSILLIRKPIAAE